MGGLTGSPQAGSTLSIGVLGRPCMGRLVFDPECIVEETDLRYSNGSRAKVVKEMGPVMAQYLQRRTQVVNIFVCLFFRGQMTFRSH